MHWFSRLLMAGAAVLAVFPVSAQESIPLSEVVHIHGVAFDSGNPDGLLLATHHGVFSASPDGTARRISQTADDFMGFSEGHVEGAFFASGHPQNGGNLGFLVSTDGGATWTQRSPGANGPVDFHALSVSRADPNVIYGLYGDIQISRDAGQTWALVGAAPQGAIDIAASPQTATDLFAGTEQGLKVSTDEGRTWTDAGPKVPVTMVEPGPDGSLYAFFAGSGLYRRNSSGVWEALNETLGGREFLHLAIRQGEATQLAAVTYTGEILVSQDEGKTWSDFATQ